MVPILWCRFLGHPVDIINKLLKFADDTKIAAVVSDKDAYRLGYRWIL